MDVSACSMKCVMTFKNLFKSFNIHDVTVAYVLLKTNFNKHPWRVAVNCGNNKFTKNCEKNLNLRQGWLGDGKRFLKTKNLQHCEESCFKRELEVMCFFFLHK